MFELLKDNDLVITNDKRSILNYLNKNKKILNIKIMSLQEFKNKYFGTYNERAIYYLIKKYNYKYEIAKMYLDNFLFIPDLKKELEQNKLIYMEPLFKESIDRIVIIDTEIDPYIKKEIEKYNHVYLKKENKIYKASAYEFENIEDEVNFVCIQILEMLKSVKPEQIFLVNVGKEYENILKRLSTFYNIPINICAKKYIYGTSIIKDFLKNLKENKDINKALESIKPGEIYNLIIDVCNKYSFTDLDDITIYCIEQELKTKKISSIKLKNAINIISIDEINNENNYYFILGCNQGILPRVHKDEDFISDKKKEKLGVFTSLEKNILESKKIKELVTSYPNIILTYKKKCGKEEYYRSSIIDDLNLEIKKININNYSYSDIYNKINLTRKLDKLIKFNIIEKDLSLLYSNYKDIPYLEYDNSFKGINQKDFLKFIDNKLLLSYSSLDNYNKCGFRYYINNILKLNKVEETFMTYIGNLFHYILSICFKENFNFDEEFNNYIKNTNTSLIFTNKEKFFINKLKKDLIFTIETIKKQDLNTSLNKSLYEQKIYVNMDGNVKVTFMGIIDKLKYETFDNKTIVAIIDYKTGNPNINLNNMIYGLDMQLPIYLYLSRNSELENVEVAGFYLQKIIHNKVNYEENKTLDELKEKEYRLEGYSNSDENVLSKFDKNYNDNSMIKGMKTSSKGFYAYSKVLNKNQLDKIYLLTKEKIEETKDNIIEANFDINPKKVGFNLLGCEYCKFNDICYKKEENIVSLEEKNYKEFLGGDIDA